MECANFVSDMQRQEIIYSFAENLTAQLDEPFTLSDCGSYWLLHTTTLPCTIVIYFPEKTERVSILDRRVFHIDLDQIVGHATKIVLRLAALLGKGKVIYGRQTVVARIDKKMTISFQEEHHLQVALPGKYRYGLFHHGELVSVAIFSGGRKMKGQTERYRSFELLRFCHKSGFRVVGGLSKLIHAFVQDFSPNDIMTYVDKDWSHDSSLKTVGFSKAGEIPPQHFWVVAEKRHYVRDDESLVQLQKAYPHGYLKLNSGSMKLVLTL